MDTRYCPSVSQIMVPFPPYSLWNDYRSSSAISDIQTPFTKNTLHSSSDNTMREPRSRYPSNHCISSSNPSQITEFFKKSPSVPKIHKLDGINLGSPKRPSIQSPPVSIDYSQESPFTSHRFSHYDFSSYDLPAKASSFHLLPQIPSAPFTYDARRHSPQFPIHHRLNRHFVINYQLEDELGSGGYGFVMTAQHRTERHEVAVKFIIKEKVPDYAWMEDETFGRLPTEVLLLACIEHENIVKCLDLYEDPLYFYLVQELHGSPWHKSETPQPCRPIPCSSSNTSIALSTPSLSPTTSVRSLATSEPATPPNPHLALDDSCQRIQHGVYAMNLEVSKPYPNPNCLPDDERPEFSRRPSHDLFECIEQSEYKRFSEPQARYVFSQVVDAVHYLASQGVTHRDIKDENLVIDKDLKVKLIDFGSAIVMDPSEPQPTFEFFYGTAAYASSEILLKKRYRAPPAEIWTLGVLLSYLLTGASPFPSILDTIDGELHLAQNASNTLSEGALDLLRRCLDPNPETRITINDVKAHAWLQIDDQDIARATRL